MREPQLAHDRDLVDVDALAHQAVLLEHEVRADTAAECAAGRRKRTQRSEVRAEDVDLDDDGLVGVMQVQPRLISRRDRLATLGR
jgi:hypothetical protein